MQLSKIETDEQNREIVKYKSGDFPFLIYTDEFRLFDEGYIRLTPKLTFEEHDEVRSYILLSFDNFTPSGNNEFRDCVINFDVVSHIDYWNLQNFQLRPIKILGYIDGLLNKTKLTGIGELNFLGANELILDKELSGYTIMYAAVHGSDDLIPVEG